ncbi:MAG: TrkA family potassium uptake protein [Solirubrobacterales bacterium]|nr:TrkA family potassium uptake protein [Solirubrobacterales bacterium]
MSRTERKFFARVGTGFGALVALMVLASAAFAVVEHVTVWYGFIWTLDIVTTLGTIQEPRDVIGRLIVIVLQLLGVGTLFFGFAVIGEFFLSGRLTQVLSVRRTQRMIDSLSNHFIVCGYGRVGRQVARDLHARQFRVVVIETNPENEEAARADGHIWLQGQASDDGVLQQAGVARAAAIIACVDSDAENVFTTLSARQLNRGITIVARASREDSEKKLLQAGADRVISPYKTTGSEMARIALHPQVDSAVDLSGRRVEQIEVSPGCQGSGRRVADVRGETVIVALRHPDGSFETQPSPEAVVSPGDRLIALGTSDALEQLENKFQPVAA